MTPSPQSSLPNSPNYYWSQSLESFDLFSHSSYNNSHKETEMYMWLFLYEMATQGDK